MAYGHHQNYNQVPSSWFDNTSQEQWNQHQYSQGHGHNHHQQHNHHHGQHHGNHHSNQHHHQKDIDPSFRPPFWPMLDLLKKYRPEVFATAPPYNGGYAFALTPAQEEFRNAAEHWQREIDWMKWSEGRTGKWLLSGDWNTVEKASKEDIGALLTATLRSERFVEGSFADFCRKGMAGRVLLRVQAIRQYEQGVLGYGKQGPSGSWQQTW